MFISFVNRAAST